MYITSDIKYIGVNDYTTDLFEDLYHIPDGISYNSYAILDEQIAIMDSVDAGFTEEWLCNMENVLNGRQPDYLIVQHMEPDHSANILNFMKRYPNAKIVASDKAFAMMEHFFHRDFIENQVVAGDGDELVLGRHKLVFYAAPMVHWPEVLMTYDCTDKVLFSADAFGRFGALDWELAEEGEAGNTKFDRNGSYVEDWKNEARRYYIGIVGKYGVFVQKLLAKFANLGIQKICPLHGSVLQDNLKPYIDLYSIWSSYQPEEDGVLIAYASVYGNTKQAVLSLEKELKENGCSKVVIRDLARCDMSEAVAEAFRYSKLVLASPTYNTQIFPPVREFISWLTERNYANRTVGFMENGSWMPIVARLMKDEFTKGKGLVFTENTVRILSALNEESEAQIVALAKELCGKA